jgi:hypothetical protein
MDPCKFCGSEQFIMLGILGAWMHVRCRHCGMDSSQYVDEIDYDERDE